MLQEKKTTTKYSRVHSCNATECVCEALYWCSWCRVSLHLTMKKQQPPFPGLYLPWVDSRSDKVALPPPFLSPWFPETRCPLLVRMPFGSPPPVPSSMVFPPSCCACSAPEWSGRRNQSRLQRKAEESHLVVYFTQVGFSSLKIFTFWYQSLNVTYWASRIHPSPRGCCHFLCLCG